MKIATHLPHGHQHTKQWTYIWWCLSGSRSRIWGLISPGSLVHQVCENMLLMDTHTRATFLDPHIQFQMFDMQIWWSAILCVSVHGRSHSYFTSLPTHPLLSSKIITTIKILRNIFNLNKNMTVVPIQWWNSIKNVTFNIIITSELNILF